MLHQVSEKLAEEIADANETEKTVSLYVMAPVMCMYVLWVLKEAIQSDKKRLYFLARDGYSMYQVAKQFCEQLNLPVECRYLYCSRYAWRHAEYHLLGEDSLNFICLGGIDVTLEKVMYRAGLSREEGLQIACLLEKEHEYQKVLSYQQVKALKPVLAGCHPFMELLEKHSQECYPPVCSYLKQEGLMQDDWAVVDSGWTGSMQKSLGHILASMGYNEPVEGYYFGMYEYPQGVDIGNYHTWYFEPHSSILRKVYFSNSLFECIFSSPEGMTLGYREVEKKYVPVLECQKSPNRDKIVKSTEYLQKYAQELAAVYGTELLHRTQNDTQKVFSLLYHFMGKPTKEEAQEFGGYIFCDDVIGEVNQRVAALLTCQEIKENRIFNKAGNFLRKKGRAVHESAWLEGSIMLCPQAGKRQLWHCVVYKYILYLRKQMK